MFDHLAAIGGETPDRPVYEGWSLQAAMAQATKRVRIGCLVTGNTYRHPALLAKIATTVDHLSGGRLEFGIGAAWATVEHEMHGLTGEAVTLAKARLQRVQHEKLELYQQRYEEYIQTAKALQALLQ